MEILQATQKEVTSNNCQLKLCPYRRRLLQATWHNYKDNLWDEHMKMKYYFPQKHHHYIMTQNILFRTSERTDSVMHSIPPCPRTGYVLKCRTVLHVQCSNSWFHTHLKQHYYYYYYYYYYYSISSCLVTC
jgi:hypothetical protein